MLNYFNQLSNGRGRSQSKSKGVLSKFLSMAEHTLTLATSALYGGVWPHAHSQNHKYVMQFGHKVSINKKNTVKHQHSHIN